MNVIIYVCNFLQYDYLAVFYDQDAGFVPNGNTNAPISEGMNGVEVERRLNQSVSFCSEHYGICHFLCNANKMI